MFRRERGEPLQQIGTLATSLIIGKGLVWVVDAARLEEEAKYTEYVTK